MKQITRFLALLTVCLFGKMSFVSSQQLQRPVAVSAYIYNFAKNIQWPGESQFKEFNFLVVGQDEKIIQEMRNMAKSKTIREKPIRITTATALSNISNVQLVFLLKDNEESLVKVFDQIEGKNILLVTDGYQDKRLFMINFFNSGKGTLQFEINKANILNQHLLIMQEMILLGGTEIDVAALYREGQQSLRSLQKQNDNLQTNVNELQGNLKQLEKTIALRNKELQDSKDSLKNQSARIQEQQKKLNSQSDKLKQSEQELTVLIAKIQEQQKVLDLQKKELEAQNDEFVKGKQELADLKEEINRRKNEIATQSEILENKDVKIHRQQNLVYLLAIISLLVVILVISLYKGYKNKQKLSKELEIRVAERTIDLDTTNKQLTIELSERKQAEKKLMESESKYRTLLENIPQKIFFKNNELVFVSCNENFAKELKISATDIGGKTDFDFFPRELAEKYRKEDADFLALGKILVMEIKEERDGKECWTQVLKVPVKDEPGNIIGVQGIFWDITERKQDEEKLRKINEELKLSNSELKILNDVILESSGQMDVKKLMSLTLNEAINLTGLESGTVWSVAENSELHLVVEKNASKTLPYDLTAQKIQINNYLCGYCVVEKKPIILKNREDIQKYGSGEMSTDKDICFHAAFPIIAKEKPLGVLCIFTRTEYKPTERSLKLVETLTSQMSLAIENANLYEKIRRQVEDLEIQVKNRTIDLENKNAQLVRMNKMFVGREIRMTELKEQIAELKDKMMTKN